MTWLVLAYLGVGYYYFRQVLRAITEYDTVDTVILNSALALTVGPCLLIPAAIVGWVTR